MLDIKLLQVLKNKKEFNSVYKSIPDNIVDPKTKVLLDDFNRYFRQFPEHDKVDLEVFVPLFKRWHVGLAPETKETYIGMLRHLDDDIDTCTKAGIFNDLNELMYGTNLAQTVENYASGNMKVPLKDKVKELTDKFRDNEIKNKIPYDTSDPCEVFDMVLNGKGLTFRLKCLNEHIRPLMESDFLILAARPDQGKTSLLASEVTYMAPQLEPDKNVIWLNNEGSSRKIRSRLFNAALCKTGSQILRMKNEGKNIFDEYDKIIGGKDRIRIFNIHNKSTGYVENLLEEHSPGLIIFDMIDNISGFTSENRSDQRLEALYQWGRNICVEYKCPGIATSQISAEGENEMYPLMGMLKESKTAKQGACDAILMLGSHKNYPNVRWLSAPKNKLRREGVPGELQHEVNFLRDKSRFEDIQVKEVFNE